MLTRHKNGFTMLSFVHTDFLAASLVEIERLVWGRVRHRVEMVSRPNNFAMLCRGHGWKPGLWIEVIVRKLTIEVVLCVHELLVDCAASHVLFLLFQRSLICDVEKVLGLVVVYNIRQSAHSWDKLTRIVHDWTVPLVVLAVLVCKFSYIQVLLGRYCECLRV